MNAIVDTTLILKAAKSYRDAGISFIPLRLVQDNVSASKEPAFDALKAVGSVTEDGKSSWEPYKQRLPVDKEMTTWFGNGRARNIAIVMGQVSRGLIAIDFDSVDAYQAWSAAHPDIASRTATQKTGKGFHVLFRLPSPTGNCKFTYAGKEHDIKGQGGYIAAWPSVHGSGHRYEWLPGQAPWEVGILTINSFGDIGITINEVTATDRPMTPVAPAKDFNPLEILKVISSHPDFEMRQKLLSVIEPVLITTETPKSLSTLSADQILTTDWPAPVWAIPGLLPSGLTILAGRPKMGKSWLALQIAFAVAAGGKVFDKEVIQGPVLYLALEDTPRRLKDRMAKQGWPTGLSADFLTLGEFDHQIGSFASGGGERLAGEIHKKGYRLVIVDTLARALRNNKIKDARSSVEMTAALSPIQEMAQKCNCAVMMVDHMRKMGSADPDVITDIMDSISKAGVADTAWGLYRERGKVEAKLQVTGRDVDEVTLAIKMDWLTAAWQCEGDYYTLKVTERRQEVLDVLELFGKTTLQKVAEATGQNKGNVLTRLKDMVANNLVEQSIENGGVVYSKK